MTTLAERARVGRATGRGARRLLALEGGVLLLAAPVLLFPEVRPAATAGALAALAVVWALSLLSARTRLPATPFNLTLLFLALAFIIGIAVTADPATTLEKATGLILGLAVWRFLVVACVSRRHAVWATGGLLLVALGFTLVGILGLQELPKIPALAAVNPFQRIALPIAIHPNQLAGLICLYLPLVVALLVAPAGPFAGPPWRAALAALGAFAVFVLILSQSRGGWLAAAAGLFVLLALWAGALPPSRARRGLWWLMAAAAIAGVVAILWIGPAALRDLWLNPPPQTAIGTLTTLNYRKELWPWAITAVGDFPFTGVGLGAFRQVAFRLYPLPMAGGQDIAHAHNIFLQTALDVGVPGLIAYVALLLGAAAAGWRAARDVDFRAISLGLLAGLAALHVFGLADALALGSKPGVVFWFAIGLLAVLNKENVIHES